MANPNAQDEPTSRASWPESVSLLLGLLGAASLVTYLIIPRWLRGREVLGVLVLPLAGALIGLWLPGSAHRKARSYRLALVINFMILSLVATFVVYKLVKGLFFPFDTSEVLVS